ncbi:MAG: hypothetical protein A2746_00550 [Candidatus Yanofskybacteria bacterium RIFCSPHIGHO2_01_FULL_44_22]|uniref:DUF5671 domain-containing protein n=1 Tax=Candidatus Yanofskybacteria bacterium RIFCSPHIGHO2_01_FULL_44_22 TaxID=1802669 RepID=A0A1F8F094_9BACT|nr:MAG: hypothetical protein A2746_00550 [Candidatus Yanofskybacteria bacterium RIFCSPHIGHO2_01_FULL_44_22]
MKKIKLVFASALAASLTAVLIAAMTIGGELSPAFKNFLAGLSGHHWVSKSFISVIFFAAALVLFYLSPFKSGGNSAKKGLWLSFFTGVFAALAIFLFFIWHYLQ